METMLKLSYTCLERAEQKVWFYMDMASAAAKEDRPAKFDTAMNSVDEALAQYLRILQGIQLLKEMKGE